MFRKILIGIAVIGTIYLSYVFIQITDKPQQQKPQDIIEKLYIEKSKNIIEKKTIMQQKQIVDKRNSVYYVGRIVMDLKTYSFIRIRDKKTLYNDEMK